MCFHQPLCISMLWVLQEPGIFYLNLWHVCKVVPIHVERDWLHVLVLCHLTVVFEIHLQNGSIFYIWNSSCNLSTVNDFGVVLGMSMTSAAIESDCGVVSSDEVCRAVLLLVLNAGPSRLVADSMLTVASLFWGYSNRWERQSAALLWALGIHSKVIWYVASSNPHLFTLLFAFSHWEFLPVVCGHCVLLFQLPEGNNSNLWLHNIYHRLLVLCCSISVGW